MKKTFLATLDFYPSGGGIANYWKNLGACMPAEQWVVLAPPLPAGEKELDAPYRIYRRNFFSRFLYPRWLVSFFHIFFLIKKERISMVVVSHILPLGTILFFLHFFTRIPYVIVSHGMDAAIPLNYPRKKYLCSRILRRAHAIIANSAVTRENIKKLGGQEKNIHIIYPCPSVDRAASQLNAHRSKGVLEKVQGKKVVLSISRLVERKGHWYVLDALPSIRAIHPDCVYVIVGDGIYRSTLEQRVYELGLGECVFFCGELRGEHICEWYDRCDVFILTPYELSNRDTEGFGMVYLEANVFGKPVIGSRCGGVPDAIIDGQTGLFVDQKNSDQIVRAVNRLFDDPTFARELGMNGKKRVEKEFQWSQAAEKYKKCCGIF